MVTYICCPHVTLTEKEQTEHTFPTEKVDDIICLADDADLLLCYVCSRLVGHHVSIGSRNRPYVQIQGDTQSLWLRIVAKEASDGQQ